MVDLHRIVKKKKQGIKFIKKDQTLQGKVDRLLQFFLQCL